MKTRFLADFQILLVYKINYFFIRTLCNKISKVRYSTPTHTRVSNLYYILYIKSEKRDTKKDIMGQPLPLKTGFWIRNVLICGSETFGYMFLLKLI